VLVNMVPVEEWDNLPEGQGGQGGPGGEDSQVESYYTTGGRW
jgi:hypothetical protein